MSYRHYPVSIARYVKWALEKQGHTVWSAGPFSPTIPWRPELDYTEYVDVPNLELPDMNAVHVDMVLPYCPFKPDLILSVDAGFYLAGVKETGLPNAIVLTDPHALPEHYMLSTEHYSKIFCMQSYYSAPYLVDLQNNPRPVWHMPYAFDSDRHFWTGTNFDHRSYDVCLISGLLYPKRLQGLAAMESAGLTIFQDSGILYENMARAYNQAVISYVQSSEQDLPARFFEGLAMRNLVLVNKVPDLSTIPDLVEGEHYVTYEDTDDLVEKARYYSQHRDEAWAIASRGFAQAYIGGHTYTRRTAILLDACGLGGQSA